MKAHLKHRRGMTLIELLVALIVMATAAVGTAVAFYTAHGQLQRQRHSMRVNQILREHAEQYQGTIHASLINIDFMTQYTRWHEYLVDSKGVGSRDDVYCRVRREPLEPVDLIETIDNPDYYMAHIILEYPINPDDHVLYDRTIRKSLTVYWLVGVN